MRSKEEIYNEATLKSYAENPMGSRMDVIYKAMEIYAIEFHNSKSKRVVDPNIRYRCLLCRRSKFDKPSPHNCVGGYRKRKIKWEKFNLTQTELTPHP